MRVNNALCTANDFYSYVFVNNNAYFPSNKSLTVNNLQTYSVIYYRGSKTSNQCLTYYEVCSYYPQLNFYPDKSFLENPRLKIELVNNWRGNITDYCLVVTFIGESGSTFTYGTGDRLGANIQLSNINSNLQNPQNQTPYSNNTSASFSYTDSNSSIRSALGSSNLTLNYNLYWVSGKYISLNVSISGTVYFSLNNTGSTITQGIYSSTNPYLSYQCNFYSLNGTPIKVYCPIWITYYMQTLPLNNDESNIPTYYIETFIDYITSNANVILSSNSWETYLYFDYLPPEAENDTITIYFNSFDSNRQQLKTPDGDYGVWSSSIIVEPGEVCYSLSRGPYSVFDGERNVKASYISITSVENVSTDYKWSCFHYQIPISYS